MFKGMKTVQVLVDLVIGVLIGVLILHPIVTLVFWIEFQGEIETTATSMWSFAADRLLKRSQFELGPMTFLFSFVGGALGLIFGWMRRYVSRNNRIISALEVELEHSLPEIIGSGENDRVEFKETLRWNVNENRVDKTLEHVIAKTICGMMNHKGGSLLIGVDDSGEIKGLERDYNTLKIKSADGFEQSIVSIIQRYLGLSVCTYVQCMFPRQRDLDICWLLIKPTQNPVFLRDGDSAKYFVRTGNSTRELDAQETLKHRDSKN
ncbi:helix-turn-helix domain-containing protein [Hyphomonas sp. GM-8P]|uniref:AlbA family DNA-binding domain-containing protein n=1 Tax=Hyphomonas sp. GM-8P TaxID=1280945 RepID=UPI000DC03B65|nr:ATP-binding protein [Hyphomonas sp. GM-8P]RAN37889.1 hypothetical protein HY26_18460 [Hyphomonas sp. GM-8P]|tara:strand:+ start:1234 stop:2025 length:792 start_codon:yes stop_codon:yes gene_type:complete